MRLSEAIRIGATMRPAQAFCVTFDRARNATCALGAAAEAVGILDTTVPNGYTGPAPLEWRKLVIRRTKCPACDETFQQLDTCIIHLNNEERWTREQIAVFVEAREHRLKAQEAATTRCLKTKR